MKRIEYYYLVQGSATNPRGLSSLFKKWTISTAASSSIRERRRDRSELNGWID